MKLFFFSFVFLFEQQLSISFFIIVHSTFVWNVFLTNNLGKRAKDFIFFYFSGSIFQESSKIIFKVSAFNELLWSFFCDFVRVDKILRVHITTEKNFYYYNTSPILNVIYLIYNSVVCMSFAFEINFFDKVILGILNNELGICIIFSNLTIIPGNRAMYYVIVFFSFIEL